MALDARPSPREVGAWLVSDVSEAALAVCIATLQADPNGGHRTRRRRSLGA